MRSISNAWYLKKFDYGKVDIFASRFADSIIDHIWKKLRKNRRKAIMEWYMKVIKQYAVFNGRATRKEYWMFTLFNFLITFGIAIVSGILGSLMGTNQNILVNIYSLAVFLPSLGVAIRRLHDTGRSGWWLLISLIPLIGAIVLIVFFIEDSQPNDNQFGPNPKTMRV